MSICLEINQLHYSPKVIEYIKGKKKSEIEALRLSLKKESRTYILSVYLYDKKDGLDIYHVYGQEDDNEKNDNEKNDNEKNDNEKNDNEKNDNEKNEHNDDAFILGALIDNKNDDIINRLSIKGVIYDKDKKANLELSNLNKMFGGPVFRLNPKTNEIIPIFSLSGKIIKDRRVYREVKKIKKDNETEDDYIKDLKKRYEGHGYHDATCPKGSPFCVHFCDYYDKVTNNCTFKCPFDRECNDGCKYYVDSRQVKCIYTKIKIMD